MVQAEIKRTLTGRIISDKREKTRTVEVKWARRHPRYGKVIRGRTKYQIHDQDNESKLGDLVEIKQVRPISKTKSWALVRVVEVFSE